MLIYDPSPGTPKRVAVIAPYKNTNSVDIDRHYGNNFATHGVNPGEVIYFQPLPPAGKKHTADECYAFLDQLANALKSHTCSVIYCIEGLFFEKLAKNKPTVRRYYIDECKYEPLKGYVVTPGINYNTFFRSPQNREILARTVATACNYLANNYVPADKAHDHKVRVWSSAVNMLAHYRDLNAPFNFIDIEAFSLKFYEAGIATLGIGTSTEKAGVATVGAVTAPPVSGYKTVQTGITQAFIDAFIDFVENTTGYFVMHNAMYDARVLAFFTFMKQQLTGWNRSDVFYKFISRIIDTKVVAFLCLNSSQRPDLGLKALSQEYMGDYAVDVKDIRTVELDTLLHYNGLDCIATAYVFEKYWQMLSDEDQYQTYVDIYHESLHWMIYAGLHGMPVNLRATQQAKNKLAAWIVDLTDKIHDHPLVKGYMPAYWQAVADKKNSEWKKKRITAAEAEQTQPGFNPGSDQQLATFLFGHLGLPVLEYTKEKQPSVSGDVLKALKNQTDAPTQELLQHLLDLTAYKKIQSTFIKAILENSLYCPFTNQYYLFGYLNLGGTVSGRLSSSSPNLNERMTVRYMFVYGDICLFTCL